MVRDTHNISSSIPQTLTPKQREMHHIVCIVFDRKDPDSRRRAHWLIRTLLDDAAKRG
jgi:hypothetical protein